METDENRPFCISVVIPAFNNEKYIARAIGSVLAQTRPADEIIVVDDGSTDGTANEVRTFGDTVRLIRQKNGGASAARNAGVLAAAGEWIAFLDADDEWLPNKLELQVEHLRRHPDLMWTAGNFQRCTCQNGHTPFDAYFIDPEQDAEVIDYFKAYISQRPGCTDTMLVKKEALIEAGLFRVGLVRINDEGMWFRIAYRWSVIGFVSQPLAIYHMGNPDSITERYKDPFIICDFLERHLALAKKHKKLGVFLPCARNMAKMWIHFCWSDERIFKVREMTRRMGEILPYGYKTGIYLLTIFPHITHTCMPFFRVINKFLKLPF